MGRSKYKKTLEIQNHNTSIFKAKVNSIDTDLY